ncbi:unknown [Parabacteroides sp. CAG:409]|nr:unknown [Parabacteroides sp. CAG:409]
MKPLNKALEEVNTLPLFLSFCMYIDLSIIKE